MSEPRPGKADGDATEPTVPARWLLPVVTLFGALALAAAYAVFRRYYPAATLTEHATFGNAVAPIAVFLSLFALVAALWSVQVQRAELALQRKELQETREEMVEQRKQFEKTAAAQEALVKSQNRLADAQEHANQLADKSNLLALYQELAQRRMALAALYQVVTSIDVARLESQSVAQPGHSGRVRQGTKEPREFAARRLREEGSRIEDLEKILGLKLEEHEYLGCEEPNV